MATSGPEYQVYFVQFESVIQASCHANTLTILLLGDNIARTEEEKPVEGTECAIRM